MAQKKNMFYDPAQGLVSPIHIFTFVIGLLLFMNIPSQSAIAANASLPKGWVYLSDIDPSIDLDMRYATSNNFTGKIVKGYYAPECVLRKAAATALKRLQSQLKKQGLSLKVYDCYRPVQAVKAFGKWSKRSPSPEEKHRYFPRLSKRQLYGKGYIATRSQHSRGNTVDLTLMPLNAPAFKASAVNDKDTSCLLPKEARVADNSLEMGTAFDCFDVLTHTNHPSITGEAAKNRKFLQRLMRQHGFKNYDMEWWHFTYKKTKTPRIYYDFPIVAKPK